MRIATAHSLDPAVAPRAARSRAVGLALGATGIAAAIVAVALWPPLPQDPAYHLFADTRELLGLDSAPNVLSNGAFALAGAAGLRVVVRLPSAFRSRTERLAWLVLFLGVAATAAGSVWYHLDPRNETLFWDRVPMAVGFAGLVAALVAERIGSAASRRWLWPLMLVSCWSVVYWAWSEGAGVGDLRAYALVQAAAVLAIPVLVALRRGPPGATRSWLEAFGLYALAKVAEVLDAPLYATTGLVSGHTLKHVLAALGVAWLARMLHRRALDAPRRPRPFGGAPSEP